MDVWYCKQHDDNDCRVAVAVAVRARAGVTRARTDFRSFLPRASHDTHDAGGMSGTVSSHQTGLFLPVFVRLFTDSVNLIT